MLVFGAEGDAMLTSVAVFWVWFSTNQADA
jgi:hypothetical protein